jgi:hypothetical protein
VALEHGEHAVGMTLVQAFSDQRLSPLCPNQVQREAARDRSERGEQGVITDSLLLRGDRHDDHEVDHFGKREERRVEECDQEEAWSAEGKREHLDAFDQAVHRAECRLRNLHRHRAVPIAVSAASFLVGSAAAFSYASAGLSLSHYDARAHLVVARRIIDSLLPGWQQVGGVWLPLPHIVNMLPVQIDWMYRTGASAIACSVLCLALRRGR